MCCWNWSGLINEFVQKFKKNNELLSQLKLKPFTHQLTELHNQQKGDALTALAQTLEDVWVFEAPAGRNNLLWFYHQSEKKHICLWIRLFCKQSQLCKSTRSSSLAAAVL